MPRTTSAASHTLSVLLYSCWLAWGVNYLQYSGLSVGAYWEGCRGWTTWAAGAQVLAAEGAALVARCLIWLAQPLLVLALRSAVRSRAFWERGLGSAW